MRDTIFALASAPGRAAVAIFRVSGPGSKAILEKVAPGESPPRQALLRTITDGERPIDSALVLWFPAPASFTGEDVFELQVHGGPAVIQAVSACLMAHGARLAEPGEFTRRAFEAGKMELSQAEAIADLIDAETEAQRRQALAQLGGSLARRGAAWRDQLLAVLAFLEAEVDFPDEDIPQVLQERTRDLLLQLKAEVAVELSSARGERIRAGTRIALIGQPNAGKSSLLNALIGRDAAIVTPVPGATRDVIEVEIVLDGYKVVIADMAGIRDASDAVEIEGVRRARAWAEAADLRLLCWDPGQGALAPDVASLVNPGDFLVVTKADLGHDVALPELTVRLATVEASAVAPGGMANLQSALRDWLTKVMAGADAPAITQARHRILLAETLEHLQRALNHVSGPELIAEDVRLAARAMERLTGRLNPDNVLDRIFSTFCIGK